MLSPCDRHLDSKIIIVLLFTIGKFAKGAKKCPTLQDLPKGSSEIHLTDTLHLSCAEYKINIHNKYYTTHNFSSLPTFISMATISMAPTPLQAKRLLLYLVTTRYGSNFSLA